MSTRALISYGNDDDICDKKAVYHHNDGSPEWLGKFLFNLIKNKTIGDLKETMKKIVDDEPVGWSSIQGDWSLGPMWGGDGPQAYSKREGEDPLEYTTMDNADQDYLYYVNVETNIMTIWKSEFLSEDRVNYKLIYMVNPFDNDEPSWDDDGDPNIEKTQRDFYKYEELKDIKSQILEQLDEMQHNPFLYLYNDQWGRNECVFCSEEQPNHKDDCPMQIIRKLVS